MATIHLKLEEGFFTDGSKCDYYEPTKLSICGWNCQILQNGDLICESKNVYDDGTHSIRYTVQKNGYAKLTLKTPTEYKTIRKGYVTHRGVPFGNGIIGLATGKIDERFAYYRDVSFQNFLDEFNLTSIKRENPNQKFSAFVSYSDLGASYQKVISDGKVNWEYEDKPSKVVSVCELYNGIEHHTVSNAKWAIVEKEIHCGMQRRYSRILYTMKKNIFELKEEIKNFK